jgi:hypothetical protein
MWNKLHTSTVYTPLPENTHSAKLKRKIICNMLPTLITPNGYIHSSKMYKQEKKAYVTPISMKSCLTLWNTVISPDSKAQKQSLILKPIPKKSTGEFQLLTAVFNFTTIKQNTENSLLTAVHSLAFAKHRKSMDGTLKPSAASHHSHESMSCSYKRR